jgi:hypothetical protein
MWDILINFETKVFGGFFRNARCVELVGAQQVVGHQVFMRENIIY